MVLRDLWKHKGLEKRTTGARGKPTPTKELDKKHKQGTEMFAILFQRTPEALLFVKMTETTNWAIGHVNVLFYMQKIREDMEIESLKQSQDIPGGRWSVVGWLRIQASTIRGVASTPGQGSSV